MTKINDIVLVHIENEPAFYARIDDISPDIKPHWWLVRLLVLVIPAEDITWILKEAYINGEDFTMQGEKIRMEKVEPFIKKSKEKNHDDKSPKVVSLFDRKK